MKNEPNTTSVKPESRARKAERPPPLSETADEPHMERLHLLERRSHRWDRRNSHA